MLPYLTWYYSSVLDNVGVSYHFSKAEWEHLTLQAGADLNKASLDLALHHVIVKFLNWVWLQKLILYWVNQNTIGT